MANVNELLRKGCSEKLVVYRVLDMLRECYKKSAWAGLPENTDITGEVLQSITRQVLGTLEGLYINTTLTDIFTFLRDSRNAAEAGAGPGSGDAPTRRGLQGNEYVRDLFMRENVRDYVNYFVFANRADHEDPAGALGVFKRQLTMLYDNHNQYTMAGVVYSPRIGDPEWKKGVVEE